MQEEAYAAQPLGPPSLPVRGVAARPFVRPHAGAWASQGMRIRGSMITEGSTSCYPYLWPPPWRPASKRSPKPSSPFLSYPSTYPLLHAYSRFDGEQLPDALRSRLLSRGRNCAGSRRAVRVATVCGAACSSSCWGVWRLKEDGG